MERSLGFAHTIGVPAWRGLSKTVGGHVFKTGLKHCLRRWCSRFGYRVRHQNDVQLRLDDTVTSRSKTRGN
ncbi:hypothetical protein IQ22_04557 [Pseudomonas duriflava]|uniref:Uncharacterized protein n=1 Tax=Pseudomonas duriflava TaxID=459528 RepID=A0A562PMT2_9PSED|nr:hypothetical protein IQ22_04557 [Pseudomonas duriflava]